tara:strand:+ start:1227 stop:1568 length:342 start_codon:yes stop_codon:yes gene_type:complete
MAIRKNKKRIDPRYFLNETAYRDELEEYSDGAASTGDVMKSMSGDAYEKLYSVMTSAPYNADPAESKAAIEKCRDEALRGALKDDFIKCMYRTSTNNVYPMQDAGLIPQQKGR